MQKSYWQSTASLHHHKPLTTSYQVDVAVIGGGITGITTAYLLKKSGLRVALLERDRCAHVDTAHTTAHLTCVTDTRLFELVHTFGKDHARALWDAGLAAIDAIEEIAAREGIDCDFRRVPGFLHASLANTGQDEREDFGREVRLALELGFDVTYIERVPLFHRPGMGVANQAKFHPLKYLAGLLEKISGDGSYIFENTAVEDITDNPLTVHAQHHTVQCAHVVIATHVPLQGKTNTLSAMMFQSKLMPYSSYAIGAKIPKGSVPIADFWDTSDPYYYLRVDQGDTEDYAIFGGEDHKTGQVTQTDAIYKKLETVLKAFVPQAKVDHRWTGQVIETNDGLPLIGEITPKQFLATGYAGNGMTFGTIAAVMARDTILGRKNPWSELFDPHRKKVLGGTWDYIKENIDYPFYMLKDHLLGSQGSSLDVVPTGEGKVVSLNGHKVAAYRDAQGNVTELSAVCTHMGCIVHWNTSDKTWDCPCHGSRFQCTGEVIGGPAETPLAKMKDGKPVE